MSEPGNFDPIIEENENKDSSVDPYKTETSSDIYATPEVALEPADAGTETTPAVVTDTHGLFSGNGGQGGFPAAGRQPQAGNVYPEGQSMSDYNGSMGSPYGGNVNPSYGGGPYSGSGAYGGNTGNTYGSNSYSGGNSAYGRNAGNAYGANPYNGGDNAYGSNPASPYGANPYNGGAYGGNTGSPYGGNTYNTPGTGNSYGAPGNGAGQPGGGYGGPPPYGGPPYGNNPYSPFAAPQKKQHTGLIIAIVLIIIFLFLVAVCALAYKISTQVDDQYKENHKTEKDKSAYDFEDDYEYHHDDDDDYDYDYDYNDDDYLYDDDYGYNQDDTEDDRYYSLHDDIRNNLSYSATFEYYTYETNDENIDIYVTYPVIEGENVPNLEKLNDTIYQEVTDVTEFYEEEVASYMKQNEDSYFSANSFGYVTYMDEDKLSIVFQESVYTDVFSDLYVMDYLYCINIDMTNGVVLDNKEMLSIDDAFSVDFRTRSDEQNGEIYTLTSMMDQQITEYFNSDDVIVFYTPMGMEIGFNHEDGWVTVTYEEYEEFLKVF